MLGSDPNRTMLGSAPTLNPNKTMMGTAPSLQATQTIKPTQCPICKTFNPAAVMFCVECGLIFERALPADAFGAPAIQLPILVDSTGKEHPVRPGQNTIGREGDILLSDARASRRHAQVTSGPDGIYLEDLGSTNGTKLNGQALAAGERRNLSGGDKLSIGGIELTFALPGSGGGNTTQVFTSNKTASMTAAPVKEVPPAKFVGEGKEFALRKGGNSLGRKSDNDVCIPEPFVSGKHGLIEVTDQGVYFTDLGSTNGTLLNDAKLAPNIRTSVSPEDVIKLGSLEFVIKIQLPTR